MRVGDPDDSQARTLPGRPVKQVVQHSLGWRGGAGDGCESRSCVLETLIRPGLGGKEVEVG